MHQDSSIVPWRVDSSSILVYPFDSGSSPSRPPFVPHEERDPYLALHRTPGTLDSQADRVVTGGPQETRVKERRHGRNVPPPRTTVSDSLRRVYSSPTVVDPE